MTLTCYKLELSGNFAAFRKFGSHHLLNEWYDRPALPSMEL